LLARATRHEGRSGTESNESQRTTTIITIITLVIIAMRGAATKAVEMDEVAIDVDHAAWCT
jgi:hypothetical protein